MPSELGDVVFERGREERCGAVRVGRAGRKLGVQVLEPAPVELGLQLGVRGRAREERMPGCEHLVREAGNGEVRRRSDAPAELRLALEDADVPARLRQERGARERVDPRADEDRIESRHRA